MPPATGLAVAQLVHDKSDSPKAWTDVSKDKQSKKVSRAKRVLCSNAARHMTKTLLAEMDEDGDLLEWFEDMKALAGE